MDNIVEILGFYTYNAQRNKICKKITKKVKTLDCTKELIIEENVCVDNKAANPISTISASRTLLQDTKDNVINMSRTIQDYETKINMLKENLAKAKGQCRKQSIVSGYMDGFKQGSLCT